jgi:hypothetical protein
MWVFYYLVCLVKDHYWIGSRDRYCLRCGKLEKAKVAGNSVNCIDFAQHELLPDK